MSQFLFLSQFHINFLCPHPFAFLKAQHQSSPRIVTHTPHKDCQLSNKDSTPSPKPAHQSHSIVTCKTINKAKNKKQIIGLSMSLKHNNFGIIYHTTELGFLLSFMHKKCWTLFLGHITTKRTIVLFFCSSDLTSFGFEQRATTHNSLIKIGGLSLLASPCRVVNSNSLLALPTKARILCLDSL